MSGAARFADTVALVAGGTGGLGQAVSRAFAAEGARVVVTYHSAGEFEALARAAGADGARLIGRQVDVTDASATLALIEEIISSHARLDVLVNAVGGYSGGAPLWQADPHSLERMLDLNLRSAHTLARAAVPAMLRQSRGCIVNVAARAGVQPPAGAAAYAASKAAALALMESLAAELAGSGVRVNSILPSIIDTPANRSAMPGADFSKWPKPEQIARVVLFLCSEEAHLIHGASIPVYGGG